VVVQELIKEIAENPPLDMTAQSSSRGFKGEQ